MRANVIVETTFSNGQEYSKVWRSGDFRKFFTNEGKYIDNMCEILNKHGREDDLFKVSYSVTVSKSTQ